LTIISITLLLTFIQYKYIIMETNIIKDLNQKCLSLKQEIETKINEVYKGLHNNVLDKIRTKIFEKHENYGESLKMMESIINNELTGDSQKIWKK